MKETLLTRFRKLTSGTLALAMIASIVAPIGNVVNATNSDPVVGAFMSTAPIYVVNATNIVTAPGAGISATITDAESAIASCEVSYNNGGSWNLETWNPSGDPKTGTCTGPTSGDDGFTYFFVIRGTDTIPRTGTGTNIAISSDGTAPVSSANAGTSSQNTPTMSIPFTATDTGSVVQQVELLFRHNGGSWTTAGTGTVSPFSFDASTHGGTGTYDFYTIATDVIGNLEVKGSPTAERTVTYNDSVPTVTLYGSASVNTVINTPYVDLGAEWYDPGDGTGNTLDATFILSGTVGTGAYGSYQLEYIKTNTFGNTGSAIRTVNVIEITPPTLGTASITPSYLTGGFLLFPNENVTFSTTVADADSGIASCGLLVQPSATIEPAVFVQDGSTSSGTCSVAYGTGVNSVGAPDYGYQWVVTDDYGNTTTGALLNTRGDFYTPVSSASGAMTVYTFSGTNVDVPFTAADSGLAQYRSGLDHLDLYSAFNGGMWVLVQTYSSGEIDTEMTLPYTLTHGTGTYEFYTIATDNVGNTEVKSSTEATITYTDLVPPTTTVTSFPTVNIANSGAVTLTGTCTNGVADDIDLLIDDGYVHTTNVFATVACTAGTWSTTQDLSGLADLTLTAVVTQSNAAGNTPGGNTRTAMKDTVAPSDPTNLSIPYDSSYVITSANSGTLMITGDAETGSTIWGVVDGVDVPTNASVPLGTFGLSLTHELVGLATGADYSTPRILTFKIIDAAGNVHYTSSGISFTKDAVAPTISVTTPIPTYTNDITPTVVINADELANPIFSGACTSSFGQLGAGNNSVVLDTLAEGTYAGCAITPVDNAGNTGATIVLSTFTVDTHVSNLYSVKMPSTINPSNLTSMYFTGLVAGDAGATVNWKFSIGGTDYLTGTTTAGMSEYTPGNYLFSVTGLDFSSLPDGSYGFQGQVVDQAGNTTGYSNGGATGIGKDTTAPVVTFVTTPVTIDANAYVIEGTASGGYNGVNITGGAAPETALIDGSGHFKAKVTLTQNATNTILVTSTDFAGNVGTGSVVITESGATDDYTSAITITVADLPYVATIGTSGTGASNIAFQTPVVLNPTGNIRVTIPAGTTIRETSENPFDYSTFGAAGTTVSSGLGTNEVSNGAIEFGISGVGINFSKLVKVEIPVTGMTSGTIPVKVKHGGSSTFGTTGLTNNPNLTCDNGRVYSGSVIPANITETNIATVVGGVATIYTCAASTFTTYSTVTPSSGSNGGTPIVTTATGTTILTTIVPTSATGTYTITLKLADFKKIRSKTVSFVTSLPVGTIIYAYRILPNGKKVKIGMTRVLRNGKFQFNLRQTGKFEFVQK